MSYNLPEYEITGACSGQEACCPGDIPRTAGSALQYFPGVFVNPP